MVVEAAVIVVVVVRLLRMIVADVTIAHLVVVENTRHLLGVGTIQETDMVAAVIVIANANDRQDVTGRLLEVLALCWQMRTCHQWLACLLRSKSGTSFTVKSSMHVYIDSFVEFHQTHFNSYQRSSLAVRCAR
jgi:hypothetical protein